jgi:hypothetical protein
MFKTSHIHKPLVWKCQQPARNAREQRIEKDVWLGKRCGDLGVIPRSNSNAKRIHFHEAWKWTRQFSVVARAEYR